MNRLRDSFWEGDLSRILLRFKKIYPLNSKESWTLGSNRDIGTWHNGRLGRMCQVLRFKPTEITKTRAWLKITHCCSSGICEHCFTWMPWFNVLFIRDVNYKISSLFYLISCRRSRENLSVISGSLPLEIVWRVILTPLGYVWYLTSKARFFRKSSWSDEIFVAADNHQGRHTWWD